MSGYIQATVDNGVGVVTLNRPKALNALDITMIRAMYDQLVGWKTDDAVHTVLVRSASDRAFCAGGDIRAIRDSALAGKNGEVYGYFSEEYRLNELIADYPKPYVALVDGVNMGGGLGVSVHGSHHVVTENAVLAMPETAIGFIPDVGASYFLTRIPGRAGLYYGLTGVRMSAGDALEAGLATHHVPAAKLSEFADAIVADGLEAALAGDYATAGRGDLDSALADHRAAIDEAFAGDDVAAIRARLDSGDEPWRVAAREALDTVSPWAQAVTAELLARGGQTAALSENLRNELRVAVAMTKCPDFREGVRAMLVDKDRAPVWSPATLAEVDVQAVQQVFAPQN